MSDTPETDGEWNRVACYEHPQFEQAIADFARKMERERDEARLDLAFRRDLYALQQKQLDEARDNVRKFSVALADSIRFSGARQDETQQAMHECDELRILVDGLSDMTNELSEDRNLWKSEAEKWRDIAYGNRH